MATGDSPIRVFLAEAQGIFRESFCAGLQVDHRISLTGATALVQAEAVAAAAVDTAADVVVAGLDDGADALPRWVARFRDLCPRPGIVLLGGDALAAAFGSLTEHLRGELGGYAVLLRRNIGSAGDLIHTVHAVADGRVVIDPALLDTVLAPQPAATQLPHFSVRETEVLRLMAAGYRNKAIAMELSITTKTVERHIQSIYSKLGNPPDAIQPRAFAVAAFQGLMPAAVPA